MATETIFLNIDDAGAKAAFERANSGFLKLEDNATRAGQNIRKSWDSNRAATDQTTAATLKHFDAHRQMNGGFEQTIRTMANLTKGFLEYASAIGAAGIAIAKTALLHQGAADVFEAITNRARTARLAIAGVTEGWGGMEIVATEIAGVIALEKIAIETYQKAQQIQAQAAQGARSGLGYQNTATLGFAAGRAGVDSGYYDSAVKAAGGVDQLASKLRELAQIQDPVDRVRQTFNAFGADVGEKMLPMLGTRFEENITRVREWGLVIDKDGRQNIDQFKRSVDALGASFQGLGDTIHAWSASVGNYLSEAMAPFFNTVMKMPGYALHGVAQGFSAMGIQPWLAPGQKLDMGVAAAGIQQNSAGFASVNLVEALRAQYGGAASDYYLNSQAGGREARLQASVGGLQSKLFVGDMTSAQYGKLVPAAQYPGGYAQQATDLQRYVSDQKALEQIKNAKDAEKASQDAEKAFASLTKTVEGMTQSILRRAEDFGADPLTLLLHQRSRDIKASGSADTSALRAASALLIQKTIPGVQQTSLADISNPLIASAQEFMKFDAKRAQQQFEQNYQASKSAVEADRAIAGINLGSDRSVIEMSAARAQKVAGLTSNDPRQAAQSAYGIQLQLANQLYDADLKRSQLESDADKRRVDQAHAYADLEKSTGEARINYEVSILEIRKSQEEGVSHTASGLFNTLFTKPRNFGRQLGSTIRSATLKPVTEGLGRMASQFITPLIYGGDGAGGIAGAMKGMFGGGNDPVKVSTDSNTLATSQNTAVMYGLSAILAAGMGMAAPAPPSGTASFGGGSISSVSTPSVSFGGGGGGVPSFPGGGGFSGGDLSALGPAYAALGAVGGLGRGGTAALAGGRGGISSLVNPKMFSGAGLSALKGQFFNSGAIVTGSGTATTAAGIGGIGGTLAGIGTSQGVASLETAVGTPLAMAGLSGRNRGTWTGVGESTAGGALTGAGIGTMILPGIGTAIGAGVGAAAGFAASTLEMLAGVESPQNKAKREVKAAYSITIDNQVANQIASLAQQKFGGNVSIAVHSPEVRQMLGIYAAGTGQKFPASAATPHAASLVEQGGQLYQGQNYQYGQGYAFQSNLPVLGAGGYATLPNPGGPSSLTLNVNGQSAADMLEGRVASVATPGYIQSQYSDALASSNGRVDNSAALNAPGLIVS